MSEPVVAPAVGLVADAPAERARRQAALARALAPASVFVAVRAAGLLVLAALAARDGSGLTDRLTTWDGSWLLAIARYGYGGVPDTFLDAFGNHTPVTALGFLPGYPAAVAAAGVLTGGRLEVAALLVSGVAGIVAAYGLARLAELVPGGSRRAGLLLVALFAATPMSVVLSMAYTEALFCALAVWALVAALREQWLVAGLCAAGAGLVRPAGSAVVAAVAVAALLAILGGRGRWRPWAGAVIGACGMVGFLAYVAGRTGRIDGWMQVQRAGWGWYVDGGGATVAYAARVLTQGGMLFEIVTVAALVGAAGLFVAAVAMRQQAPLLVYGAVSLLTLWGTSGLMNTKLRLLVPVFVLFLPLAVALARRRTATAVVVTTAVALGSAWFGAYALTTWHYGI